MRYDKIIFNTIITHQNENMTLRYFNDILRYEQATTSAIAAGETLDQGEHFGVLVHVVTPTQRQDIASSNLGSGLICFVT